VSISDAEYLEWLSTDNERIVLVRADAWTGAAVETFTICDRRWYDDVNGDIYIGRLRDDLEIIEALSMDGEQGESNVSVIGLHNEDGALDDWLDYAWAGQPLEILFGGPDWPFDDFRPLFTGRSERIEAVDDTHMDLHVGDNYSRLDRPIVEETLSMHPSSFLRPYPLALGEPQNVTPPISYGEYPSPVECYLVNTWAVDADHAAGAPAYNAVYENGLATTKSLDDVYMFGGSGIDLIGFYFDVNDPEGSVTCDPVTAIAQPLYTPLAVRLETAGAILEYLPRYEMKRDSGFTRLGGFQDKTQLNEKASSSDDYYSASVLISRRESDVNDTLFVDTYKGATRTVTFTANASFTISEGDRYDAVTPENVVKGPLTDAEIDSAAMSQIDSDAGYKLGIWDGGGDLTYIGLFDALFPAGFYHHFNQSGVLTAGLQKDPSAGVSVMSIGGEELMEDPSIVADGYPIYRVRVGCDLNWTKTSSPDEGVSTERAAFLARDYQWEPEEDVSILASFPDATPQDFPSYILDRSDARTEAERLLDLYKVQRYRAHFPARLKILAADLHDVITFDDERYGLHNGKDVRLVGRRTRPLQDRSQIEAWW
jgi:hypothetical protein